VEALRQDITNWSEVAAYREFASQKNEMERTNTSKEKTGVLLEGVTAQHPATGEHIPVFIADYVLKHYGTSAVMGVPAHDERDYEFALKYGLHMKPVIAHDGELPYLGTGRLMNSGVFDGMNSEEAKGAITKQFGGVLANTYRLRDWSIGRQRYWGVPIPIVYDPEGNAHVIPKEHLPWKLPTDVDFTPTGEPPLAKSAELRERVTRIFGEGWTPEVETMDTFVDSSWYFLRYLDAHDTDAPASLNAQKDWMPVDVYFGGSEHTTMHLLYSRFWQKALYDLGLVIASEPYALRINRGLILGPDGNKMSKSKGNIIDPDEQVQLLGADTVKMYLAFMGPYGEPSNYPWDLRGIAGLRRFLERVYGLQEHISETETEDTRKLLHKTIEKVTKDIQVYKFNTAISALMIFLNHAERAGLSEESYHIFLKVLAPFAPHLTEELWHLGGHTRSIHTESWPAADPRLITEQTVTISVQIAGKMRGRVSVPAGADEKTVLDAISADAALKNRLTDSLERVIYVQNKIINIILKRKE
jgi:leucyl-tRNA synthetase